MRIESVMSGSLGDLPAPLQAPDRTDAPGARVRYARGVTGWLLATLATAGLAVPPAAGLATLATAGLTAPTATDLARPAAAGRAAAEPPLALRYASPEITRDGDLVRWPDLPVRHDRPVLEATLALASGALVHYRSPGCGEVIDLASGRATLGCGRALGPHPLDGRVELALDAWRAGEGLEHTRVRLGAERLTACLGLATCAGADLQIAASAEGQALHLEARGPVALENNQVEVTLERGAVRLETSRRGGGPYRDDAVVRLVVEGRAAVANGRLRASCDGDRWSAWVLADRHTNAGTSVELSLPGAGVAWTEIDGRYRHAERPGLQTRLDAVAPDPTYADQHGLGPVLRSIAEDAFKSTVRWLRPQGRLIPVSRRDEELAAGVRLVTLDFRRESTPGPAPEVLPGELTVVGVVADPAHVAASLDAPCRDDAGLAAINGYAFSRIDGGALLPEAGLVVDGQVHGRLRVDAWWANLVIDHDGRVGIEGAREFYARQGLDASVTHLLQGTLYVRGGKSVRHEGDNPEVNWRSAVGLGRGGEIILAHTLVPMSGGAALTAYGRGLTQAEMADVLVDLGAVDALVLDGGPSAALSLDGRLVSGGLRGLPLCLTLRAPEAVLARSLHGTASSGTSSLR